MRKLCLIGLLCAALPLYANTADETDALLNKVTLRLTAEQWVNTKTALVTVGVNASVSDHALDKVQSDVLAKLTQLSNEGEWHVTSFNRSLDQSGLEHVQMSAQARLPSSALSNLRDKTKTLSKPGETYTLDDVQFTPSEDDLRAANIALRTNIYAQAKDEAARIMKAYPEQKYTVHYVNFLDMPPMQPMAMQAMMKMGDNMAAAPRAPLIVGDKLTLNAVVVLAAAPDTLSAKT